MASWMESGWIKKNISLRLQDVAYGFHFSSNGILSKYRSSLHENGFNHKLLFSTIFCAVQAVQTLPSIIFENVIKKGYFSMLLH